MKQKYNLQHFLFEDASVTDINKPKLKAPRAPVPSNKEFWKGGTNVGQFNNKTMTKELSKEINDTINSILTKYSKIKKNIAIKPQKSEEYFKDVENVSLDNLKTNISDIRDKSFTIGKFLYPEESPKEPNKPETPSVPQTKKTISNTAITEPEQPALAFDQTQPQPQYRPNQTQPVPQVDIERTMRNAPTTPMPQATQTKQPNIFQRFKNRIGLEE